MTPPHLPPGYVTFQGQGSKTFTPPSLDGSMLFGEWIDWMGERCGEHVWTILAGDQDEENVSVTWGEAVRAAHRFAAKLRQDVPYQLDADGKPPIIGVLSMPHPLVYATLILAITRAGFLAFPISVRLSVPALEHLLNKTGCKHLFGSLPSSSGAASALQNATAALVEKVPSLRILNVPAIGSLYPRLGSWPPAPYDASSDARPQPELPAPADVFEWMKGKRDPPVLFLHSSGSTAFPKPIPMHNRIVLTWARLNWYSDTDLCGTRWAGTMLPIFHVMGIMLHVGMAMAGGVTAVMLKPTGTPVMATPENALAAIKKSAAQYVLTVPSFCAEWAADPKAIEILKRCEAVTFAGGPLAEEKGEQLVRNGVSLCVEYGLTEAGPLFIAVPKKENHKAGWQWGRLTSDVRYRLVPEGERIYRLVVIDSESHGVALYNVEGENVFDTSDLLEEHPQYKGYWRVVGRSDDQITMANGEKVNPGPLEDIILGNRHVRAALMFGRTRDQVGIIVEPAVPVDITNEAEVSRFRNLIWPDVEKANNIAPAFARLFKEFILVIDPEQKPLARTPKGTVQRNVGLKQYEQEIEAIYRAAEEPAKAEWAVPPASWDPHDVEAFVARVVNGVMRHEGGPQIKEGGDLFEQGCDSLQATYIRVALTKALVAAPGASNETVTVPNNLVFLYPTIGKLTSYLLRANSGRSDEDKDVTNAHEHASLMLSLAQKYSSGFIQHTKTASSSGTNVVLITGTTGMLGTYLLGQALQDDRIACVYALNRTSSEKSLKERQEEAFGDRGLDATLVASRKLVLLEGDTRQPDLGLSHDVLAKIRSQLTAIIHNAWRLDFNLGLSSFESHIASTRNLIDLALSSGGARPAQFIFTSSISALSSWREAKPVPEEAVTDPSIAVGTGYGESKWVAEQVIGQASKQRGLPATIWRVGQLAGSTINGAWNTTDWVPIMVKSATETRALPDAQGQVSWVPIDKAASSILDSVVTPAADGGARYLHLVHPRPAAWHTIFGALAHAVSVPLIPYTEWISKLEELASGSSTDPTLAERIPALKLLDFFRAGQQSAAGSSGEKQKFDEAVGVDLATARTLRISETLRSLEMLKEEDVNRWLDYWRTHGFLT